MKPYLPNMGGRRAIRIWEMVIDNQKIVVGSTSNQIVFVRFRRRYCILNTTTNHLQAQVPVFCFFPRSRCVVVHATSPLQPPQSMWLGWHTWFQQHRSKQFWSSYFHFDSIIWTGNPKLINRFEGRKGVFRWRRPVRLLRNRNRPRPKRGGISWAKTSMETTGHGDHHQDVDERSVICPSLPMDKQRLEPGLKTSPLAAWNLQDFFMSNPIPLRWILWSQPSVFFVHIHVDFGGCWMKLFWLFRAVYYPSYPWEILWTSQWNSLFV